MRQTRRAFSFVVVDMSRELLWPARYNFGCCSLNAEWGHYIFSFRIFHIYHFIFSAGFIAPVLKISNGETGNRNAGSYS